MHFFSVLVICATFALSTASLCSSNGITDVERNTLLAAHNKYRASGVNGKEKDAKGGNAPQGSASYQFSWNCSVEATAQAWADKCVWQHSNTRGVGENIMYTRDNSMDKNATGQQAADLWWNELKELGVGKSNMKPSITGVGHYTQMAWGSTYSLGCGIATCPDMNYVVCQYYPPGNYIGEIVYKLGKPCSACPSGSKCSKEYPGLCKRA